MNKDAMIRSALDYKKQYGFSVIPITPSTKKPWIYWEKHQTEYATDEEIKQWFEDRPNSMVGVVTGKLSDLDVIDVDGTEIPQKLGDILGEDSGRIPHTKTPRGGQHLFFKHQEGVRNRTNIWKAEKDETMVDVRGEGGYAVLPPSCNGIGKEYKWIFSLANERPTFPEELLKIVSDTDEQGKSIIRDIKFTQGNRDDSIFHLANSLRRSGMPREEAEPYVLNQASLCDPPFPEREALAKLESAYKRGTRDDVPVSNTVDKPISEATVEIRQGIREWVEIEVVPGQSFHVRDAHEVVNAREPNEKKAVSKELNRLVEKGILEKPLGKPYGNYKKVDNTAVEVDYLNSSCERFGIELPLGLDSIITLSPSDLIVVAGESGAGKTSFALDLMKKNKGKDITYLSSELTGGKMKQRLLLHEDMELNDWTFTMKNREVDFATVINPDEITIVDFIVVTEDFWKSAHALREIHNKMINGKGLCFAFLQKGKNKESGSGGDLTQQHASLYLSITKGNPNYMKFLKVREFKNSGEISNPLGKVIPFKLINGWKFNSLSDPVYQDDYEQVNKKKW